MLLESIVITIIKKGFGVKPSYNLTVKGDGKVVYKGIENVKVKGVVESLLEDDKVISIMSGLKDSGFFLVDKDSFVFDESSNRSFTSIKVDMPGENNTNKSKIVSYYDDDSSVTLGLKNFEKKVIELTGADKWMSNDLEKPVKENNIKDSLASSSLQKPVKNISDKKINNNKKFVKIIVPAAIGIVIVLCLVFFVFLNNTSNDSETPDVVYDPPIILSLTPASSFVGNIPSSSDIFGVGDSIYICFEYSNVTHDTTYDFVGTVNVYYGLDLIDTYSFDVSYPEEVENNHSFISNDSWDVGDYRVVFELNDEISDLNTNLETSFTLYDKIPKILKFTTASSVTTYKVYTAKSIFDINDTVFVYLEYTGINTTNDNTICNINLSLSVTSSGTEYYSSSQDKTNVGNNSQAWWFNLDYGIWPDSSLYNININLYDYTTDLSASDSSYFYIS